MKRVKGVVLLLITCFLAFAPPGTIILGLLFIAGLIQHCNNTGDNTKSSTSQPAAVSSAPATTPTPAPTPEHRSGTSSTEK